MDISEVIPAILNDIIGGRVWYESTPPTIPRGPDGKFLPFIIWTLAGGLDVEYVDQRMGDKSNARVQIAVFAPSSIAAGNLMKLARDTMLASDYAVGVYGSPVGTYDTARDLRGRFQQFSIWYPQ